MSAFCTEADYENSIIELFESELGYTHVYGPDLETRDFTCPFYDAVVANAILGRILHHSHVITITGNSYRLKDCVSRIIVHFYLTFYERYHWWSKY